MTATIFNLLLALSFLIGFLVFSSLHIVVGEQVPKTLAIREPVPVSQWIAYPLHATFLLLYPLSWLLNTASRSILRMLGVREPATHEILTDVEFEHLVEESAEHGNIEEGQAEFIQNVFRFGELVVSDVMVHRTEMITVCWIGLCRWHRADPRLESRPGLEPAGREGEHHRRAGDP
jgi:CBS domain containing-hemolysin-like protein